MNKKLYYIRNASLIIVFASLLYSFRYSESFLLFIVFPLITAHVIMAFLQSRNDIDEINLNNKYNILFSLSNLYVIIIVIRNFFDPHIIINQFISSKTAIFLSNNFIIIIILYIALLIYSLLLKKENKTH